MGKITNKWIAVDAVDNTQIDFGTGANQVKAADLPIVDTGSYVTATQVEAAIQEICAKYIANWDLISSFSALGGSDDIDTEVKATAGVDTARTSFTSGTGVFVDASGAYGAGGSSLPANGVTVTELGVPGYVQIKESATKDPITDGNGNQVYGVLFYNTTDSKFYVKYFSDVADVQTAYSFGTAKNIDLAFAEIFNLINMPAEGFVKSGLGNVDVGTSNITGVTAGNGLTGGGTSGVVTLDVSAGDGIDVATDSVSVDVSDIIDTTKGLTEDTNNIQVNITPTMGLDFNGTTGALEVDVTDLYDAQKGLTESANQLQVKLTVDKGLDFTATTYGLEVDTSDIIDTNYGLTEDTNKIRINLESAGGLEFHSTNHTLQVKADGIKDSMIDFGTGAGQINADDIPAGSTYEIPTSTDLTNYDNHLASTSNPHSVTYSQVGAIQNANDTVKDTHIDWGTGTDQVGAVDVPIADAGGLITGTNVESALQELAGDSSPTAFKFTMLTLNASDITNGFKALGAKARGAVGVKSYVQVHPVGGPIQEHLTDFVAMNNDANTALVIIWTSINSDPITGIASPTYPTAGLRDVLTAGDKLLVYYE